MGAVFAALSVFPNFVESSVDPSTDRGNDNVRILRSVVMRTVFASLLSVLLVVHAAVGCCWYCAHPESCQSCRQTTDSHCSGCCHRHDGPQHKGSHGPCKSRSGCQGLCTYLPAQKVQIGRLLVQAPMDFAVIDSAVSHSPALAELSINVARQRLFEPPVRLHLFHQILLI